MDATATPAVAHRSPSKYHTFIQIALLLSAITGVEIVLVYLPFARWLVLSLLVILSTVKFIAVIAYFMHLRWDKIFCTLLFFIGLALALGTVAALLAVFSAEASRPGTNQTGALPPRSAMV